MPLILAIVTTWHNHYSICVIAVIHLGKKYSCNIILPKCVYYNSFPEFGDDGSPTFVWTITDEADRDESELVSSVD